MQLDLLGQGSHINGRELVEDGAQRLIAGLNKMQKKRLELAGSAGKRTLRIADSRYLDLARSRSCIETKFGKMKQAVGMEMLEESSALLLFRLPGRTFPLEEFAKSSGKLGQPEVGGIADHVANKPDFMGRRSTPELQC